MRGEGRAFCSGAAVTEMDAWPPDALRVILNPLVTRLRNFDLPLITEMNGLAAGFACSIVLMAVPVATLVGIVVVRAVWLPM